MITSVRVNLHFQTEHNQSSNSMQCHSNWHCNNEDIWRRTVVLLDDPYYTDVCPFYAYLICLFLSSVDRRQSTQRGKKISQDCSRTDTNHIHVWWVVITTDWYLLSSWQRVYEYQKNTREPSWWTILMPFTGEMYVTCNLKQWNYSNNCVSDKHTHGWNSM